MKTIFITVLMLLAAGSYAQQASDVETFDDWDALFKYQDIYISGQPEKERLEWFKEHDVVKIINLRSEDEIEEFTDEEFNEKKEVKKLGMDYVSIPIDGWDDYTHENLEKLINEMPDNQHVVIHCAGAGRANNFFMAYLVEGMGYDLNTAFSIGKQIRYVNPLEELLDKEIEYNFKSEEKKSEKSVEML